jgi:hypothetical protein
MPCGCIDRISPAGAVFAGHDEIVSHSKRILELSLDQEEKEAFGYSVTISAMPLRRP